MTDIYWQMTSQKAQVSSSGLWTLLIRSCTRTCFSQEMLDQMILEVPSNLAFYGSVILWNWWKKHETVANCLQNFSSVPWLSVYIPQLNKTELLKLLTLPSVTINEHMTPPPCGAIPSFLQLRAGDNGLKLAMLAFQLLSDLSVTKVSKEALIFLPILGNRVVILYDPWGLCQRRNSCYLQTSLLLYSIRFKRDPSDMVLEHININDFMDNHYKLIHQCCKDQPSRSKRIC